MFLQALNNETHQKDMQILAELQYFGEINIIVMVNKLKINLQVKKKVYFYKVMFYVSSNV